MTNGGINNPGALRLIVDAASGVSSVKLTYAQADAIMRCESLEIVKQQSGSTTSVDILYPMVGYVPFLADRTFVSTGVIGEGDAVNVVVYQISYNKEQNAFTEKGAILTPQQA